MKSGGIPPSDFSYPLRFEIPMKYVITGILFHLLVHESFADSIPSPVLFLLDRQEKVHRVEQVEMADGVFTGTQGEERWEMPTDQIKQVSTTPLRERILHSEASYSVRPNRNTHLKIPAMPSRYQVQLQVPAASQLYVYPVVNSPDTPNLKLPSLLIRRGEIGFTNFQAPGRSREPEARMQAPIPLKASLSAAKKGMHHLTLQVDLNQNTLQALDGENKLQQWDLPILEFQENPHTVWLRFRARSKDVVLPALSVFTWEVAENGTFNLPEGTTHLLILANGDILEGTCTSLKGDSLVWKLEQGPEITLPLERVHQMIFRETPKPESE